MPELPPTSRRSLIGGSLSAGALAAAFTATPSAEAARAVPTNPSTSYYLTIPGIPGDVTSKGFSNAIEVLDLSFGVTTTQSPFSVGGGSGSGKSKPTDLVVVTRSDRSSPLLFEACAAGRRLQDSTLQGIRSFGEGNKPFVKVTLRNLYLRSWTMTVDEVTAAPLDVVHLLAGSITVDWSSSLQDGSTPHTVRGFNFVTNRSS